MKLHEIRDGQELDPPTPHVLIDDTGKEYLLNAATAVTVDGAPAAISSLAQGMDIELELDGDTVKAIRATV